jgi:hypothetical protein
LSRSLRVALTIGGIVVVLAALGYAAHSMNLIGLLISMHTPPPH